MIVQCEQCRAKFRLDESKIKGRGVKVNCTRCNHIFVVLKEAPAADIDVDSLPDGPGGLHLEPTIVAGEAVPPDTVNISDQNESTEEKISFVQEESDVEDEEKMDFDFGVVDLDDASILKGVVPPESESQEPEGSFFYIQEEQDQTFFYQEEEQSTQEPDNAQASIVEESVSNAAFASSTSGYVDQQITPAFNDFEDAEFTSTVKTDQVEEQPATHEEEFWAEPPEPAEPAEPSESSESSESSEPFREPVPLVPVPETQAETEKYKTPAVQSRRRSNSALPAVLTTIAVIFLLAVIGTGIYYKMEGPVALENLGVGFMTEWFGLEVKDTGRIEIKNPVATLIVNKEAGEMLVINGEAVNNFSKPRASIQIKTTLLGSKGEVLAQKTAYCGNYLSPEQLATLPIAKLEAAMSNQSGDALSNLSVGSGKGLPCVVVFNKFPAETAELSVEASSSAVSNQ
jgi:predicted Zn finger-like uncharacterized protein